MKTKGCKIARDTVAKFIAVIRLASFAGKRVYKLLFTVLHH